MTNNCVGLGTDIIEIERVKQGVDEHGEHFLNRLFTPKEQAYCQKYSDPHPHYAGRFAAKEAIAKALGYGFGKEISFLDLEILNDAEGKPIVHCSDKFKESHNFASILISISHCKTYALATALCLQ
jgi:holo-[acyl-carrier protein] synthase